MIYDNILPGEFISRPNRFIAHVRINGMEEICHVKNTGRCKELLLPGARVYLQRVSNPKRVTEYDLISVWKGKRLINIDSQVPNRVVAEWLHSSGYIEGITLIKPEAAYENSRFDFYLEAGERRIFIEVKGVTLEQNSIAMFPDAPTLRGVKHIEELCASLHHGFEAMIVFVIQMKGVLHFTPNYEMHADFGHTLNAAASKGVNVIALDCEVTENSIVAGDFVKVIMDA